MSENHAEKEPRSITVKAGQWFTPLVELVQYPDERRDNSRYWHYPFTVEELGNFDMDITHSDNWYKTLKEEDLPGQPGEKKTLLILPDRVEPITEKNIHDWQKELETPILSYHGMSAIGGPIITQTFPAWKESTRSPVYLEVETPSGHLLRNPFVDFVRRQDIPRSFTSHHIGSLYMIWNDKLDVNGMLFPEGKHILERTHFRIVRD